MKKHVYLHYPKNAVKTIYSTMQFSAFIQSKDIKELTRYLNGLSGFEIADMISKKSIDDQVIVFTSLNPTLAASTFDYLTVKNQKQLLHALPSAVTASMLEAMHPDDRTQLLEELSQEAVDEYLKLLTPEERVAARTLLNYPEDRVGRLMTTDYLAIRLEWTVEKVLDHIRKYGHDSESIDVLYVLDDQNKLIDDINIKDFLFVPKEHKVSQLSNYRFISLSVTGKIEDAINVFKEHDRVALPVLNDKGVMLGIVTIDDILRASAEKDTENMQKVGGTEALDEPYMETPFLELMKKRARWLIILFIGEMLTATAMGFFEAEIAKAVVLALFLPLIISSGGNAGSQSSTLIIRAMALGEVKLRDWWRVMHREIYSGLFLGCILGLIGFMRVAIWGSATLMYGEHWLLVAFTVCLALIGVVLWGSLSGSMLPLILRRFGYDPATSSAPLVATLVDVTGISIYFGIALVILKGSLL